VVACLAIRAIRSGCWDADYPWLPDHAHASGPWCWVLANPRRLPRPIPWRGAQGLWSYDGELPG